MMSKFDVSDNMLKAISDGAIKVNPTEGRKMAEELLVLRGRVHLPAAPVAEPSHGLPAVETHCAPAEPPKPDPVVEYWRHRNSGDYCKTIDRIIVDTIGAWSLMSKNGMTKLTCHICLETPITAAEYESTKASGKIETLDAPKRIEPLSDRAKYTRHQAANLCWDKVNELCEAWNERVGAK